MHRKRLLVLFGLVAAAVLAVGLAAGGSSAKTTKKQAGYKIFVLPKLIGVNVFTENGKGAKTPEERMGSILDGNRGSEEGDSLSRLLTLAAA